MVTSELHVRPAPDEEATAPAPRPGVDVTTGREAGGRPAPRGASPEALLLAVGAGDHGAFAALYDRLAPAVLGVSRRVLRDPALAEEVAQEALLEVWRKASRFDPARGSAAAWVVTLAHRRAVDRVRSEQARRDRVQRAAWRERDRPVDDVVEAVEARLDHERVRVALGVLSDRQREAIELAYFRGHTYREVARLLDIPEGTAKSRLRDGLLRLREALAESA